MMKMSEKFKLPELPKFGKGSSPEIEKLLPASPPAPPIPRFIEESIPEEMAFWRRIEGKV